MKKIFIIIAVSLALFSCKNDKKAEDKKEMEKQVQEQIQRDNEVIQQKEETQKIQTLISEENIEKEEEKKAKKKETAKENPPKKTKSVSQPDKSSETPKEEKIDDQKIFKYQSKEGERLTVIFRTYDNKKNYIEVKCPGKPTYKLDQEEAWAKGAIYQKDTIRMEFDFAKATLSIGDEKTEYEGNKEISN